jgi:Tfp pilus assembly protein PilF
VRNEFDLPHPDRARFDDVFGKYFATYDTLSSRIVKLPSTAPDASAMKEAVKRADESFPDWWAVAVKAERLKDTDPDQANAIYSRGSEQFPQSALLLGFYAVFLAAVRQDYDGADKHFRRALEVDPSQEAILTNYAFFLYRCRKDYDGAEQRYRRALEIKPNDALILSSYALFLADARKDYDAAEEHFRRALEVNPNQEASSLGTYAFFLYKYRKDYDAAEEYFRRALAVDPNHTNNLGNYATFLYLVRKDYDRAEEHFRRALAADPNNANDFGNYAGLLLAQGKGPEGLSVLDRALALAPGSGTPGLAAECWFYAFAHRSEEARDEALGNLKRLLASGDRSPNWDLAPNIAQARKDGHPDAIWLEKLAAVITDGADIKTLDAWPRWKKA